MKMEVNTKNFPKLKLNTIFFPVLKNNCLTKLNKSESFIGSDIVLLKLWLPWLLLNIKILWAFR